MKQCSVLLKTGINLGIPVMVEGRIYVYLENNTSIEISP